MGNLQTEFLKHSIELNLTDDKRILVAVSGGVDSMVLCDLLIQSHIKFSVAHCNFQLRGIDSDEDAFFVEEFCKKNQLELFSKKFDVEKFKQEKNYSIQMAARELRYDWFSELMKSNDFDCLLTAHHQNDSFETFLINLSRGTGIEGLVGIQNIGDTLFRPLLPFSKEEIRKYASENKVKWREDISNFEDGYVRNKIRHQITPVLNEIHPNFLKNFSKSVEFLKSDRLLIQNYIETLRKELFKKKEDAYFISIQELKELYPLQTYLYYLFSDFGFKHPLEVEKLLFSTNNGEIQSPKFRLIKNREEFILLPIQNEILSNEIEIKLNQMIEKPLYLKISKSEKRDFSASESLDLDAIQFPLRLRKQKTGDVFYPLGMKGSKKLSKFFKDEKFSKVEKENTWILVDNEDQILYIVGKRADDRFKINENTHKFLNIYLC